jgi:hypothetical protein
MNKDRVRFEFHCPEELAAAIEKAAEAKMCSRSSWVRQAALLALSMQQREQTTTDARTAWHAS